MRPHHLQFQCSPSTVRSTRCARFGLGLLAAVLSFPSSAQAAAPVEHSYPQIEFTGNQLTPRFEADGQVHLVLRSSFRVQMSASPHDFFGVYRVKKLFRRSGVSYLVCPHMAGRFESLETGPSYMESFVGHLIKDGSQVWGFDNRGADLTPADAALPEVQALVGSWGLDSLVADAKVTRDLMGLLSWPFSDQKYVIGGQSLGAITALMSVNAEPQRYDGMFINEGSIYSADPMLAGDNQDLDGDGFEDNPGLADLNFEFMSSVVIPTLGTADPTGDALFKTVLPLAFSPAGLVAPRPELDMDPDPLNDAGEVLLDAIDAAFIAQRGTPMNLREFVIFALSVPGPNPSAPPIPSYVLASSLIQDLGSVPFGDLSDLGDLADPSKYVLDRVDVDRMLADGATFNSLASREIFRELSGCMANAGVNPVSGTDHVGNLGAFSGHCLFLSAQRGFGSTVNDASSLMTGAASNQVIDYVGYGHGDIRFSTSYVADQMGPILALGELVK